MEEPLSVTPERFIRMFLCQSRVTEAVRMPSLLLHSKRLWFEQPATDAAIAQAAKMAGYLAVMMLYLPV
jgi:hypothetical protein